MNQDHHGTQYLVWLTTTASFPVFVEAKDETEAEEKALAVELPGTDHADGHVLGEWHIDLVDRVGNAS